MSYFLFAIPMFAVFIVLEALLSKDRSAISVPAALSNISCGALSELTNVIFKLVGAVAYVLVYRWAPLDLPTPAQWVIAMLGVDLCYYFGHRAGHQVGLIWATHVVHHQSEQYNLSVALRQSAFGSLLTWPFYLPLALFGIRPEILALSYAINLLYQFFIHTEAIGKLGPLELVLNTPSHHRVHHGRNPEYLDKNYGGILIVWDRWFGTFEPERAKADYGVTKPFRRYNPWEANFQGFRDLYAKVDHQPTLTAKWRAIWQGPGEGEPWPPAIDAAPVEMPLTAAVDRPWRLRLEFAGILLLSATTLLLFQRLPPWAAWSLWLAVTTWLGFFLR